MPLRISVYTWITRPSVFYETDGFLIHRNFLYIKNALWKPALSSGDNLVVPAVLLDVKNDDIIVTDRKKHVNICT